MSLTAEQARANLALHSLEPQDDSVLELSYADALIKAMSERQQHQCTARLHPSVVCSLIARHFFVRATGPALEDGRMPCEIQTALRQAFPGLMVQSVERTQLVFAFRTVPDGQDAITAVRAAIERAKQQCLRSCHKDDLPPSISDAQLFLSTCCFLPRHNEKQNEFVVIVIDLGIVLDAALGYECYNHHFPRQARLEDIPEMFRDEQEETQTAVALLK